MDFENVYSALADTPRPNRRVMRVWAAWKMESPLRGQVGKPGGVADLQLLLRGERRRARRRAVGLLGNGQTRALGADVFQLDQQPVREGLLQREAPRLRIGQLIILVDRVRVGDGLRRNRRERVLQRLAIGRAGGERDVGRKRRLCRHAGSEPAVRRAAEENAVAAADHARVLLRRPPRETQPRRVVVLVRVYQAGRVFAGVRPNAIGRRHHLHRVNLRVDVQVRQGPYNSVYGAKYS